MVTRDGGGGGEVGWQRRKEEAVGSAIQRKGREEEGEKNRSGPICRIEVGALDQNLEAFTK